jgi:hypothetical protein
MGVTNKEKLKMVRCADKNTDISKDLFSILVPATHKSLSISQRLTFYFFTIGSGPMNDYKNFEAL